MIDRYKVQRERTKARQKLMKEDTVPELTTIHFDGKKVKMLKILKNRGSY